MAEGSCFRTRSSSSSTCLNPAVCLGSASRARSPAAFADEEVKWAPGGRSSKKCSQALANARKQIEVETDNFKAIIHEILAQAMDGETGAPIEAKDLGPVAFDQFRTTVPGLPSSVSQSFKERSPMGAPHYQERRASKSIARLMSFKKDEAAHRETKEDRLEEQRRKELQDAAKRGTFELCKYRTDLAEDAYDVKKFYHTDGICQEIVRSAKFTHLTEAVIALYCVYLGIDADHNKASTSKEAVANPWPFYVCENAFCTFFLVEILLRFGAFQKKLNCLKDGWFKFDTVLVALMVFDTWVMPLLSSGISGGAHTAPMRLLRLLRLSRMVRLMRSWPELLTVFGGLRAGSRALGACMFMVLVADYISAIVVNMMLQDEVSVADNFGTVPLSMWTLLMDATLMDSLGLRLGSLLDLRTYQGYIAIICIMVYMLFSSLMVLNMLIGILCEVVSVVGQGEKDAQAIKLMKDTILVELKKFDHDSNGTISREELNNVLRDSHAQEVLALLEVDMEYMNELQDILFRPADIEIPYEHIMDMMLKSRGDLPTTVDHMAKSHALTRYLVESRLKYLMQEQEVRIQLMLKRHLPNPTLVGKATSGLKADEVSLQFVESVSEDGSSAKIGRQVSR